MKFLFLTLFTYFSLSHKDIRIETDEKTYQKIIISKDTITFNLISKTIIDWPASPSGPAFLGFDYYAESGGEHFHIVWKRIGDNLRNIYIQPDSKKWAKEIDSVSTK